MGTGYPESTRLFRYPNSTNNGYPIITGKPIIIGYPFIRGGGKLPGIDPLRKFETVTVGYYGRRSGSYESHMINATEQHGTFNKQNSKVSNTLSVNVMHT